MSTKATWALLELSKSFVAKVWWPGMERDAEKYCKTCHGCQLVSCPTPPEPIRTTPLPTGPWRDLAIDLLGPLPTGESILVVVDYYSRYYEVDILKSTVASKVISSLEEMFARHGLPVSLTSDKGPQFRSAEFQSTWYSKVLDTIRSQPNGLRPMANLTPK